MAKVFTIAEGLENMGAIKSGGQGSLYKGRRIGEIITAIKLLPTPIYSESTDDKNYLSFRNEVEKLKKVNEEPNPHVVKILSSGITESGNFPFIEMEYIEGPDLEELLKPPHNPVFTIKEAIKVADQLSNALAHCHRLDIKHGDIKSNNVKFNINSGNYVLLDFGLAIMNDEQRRSSMRQAGAIEFMAPEQSEGEVLLQTDVYGFGVILFELLSGNVPFPLKDKGETARNHVLMAHLETPPPDLVSIRQHVIPAGWPEEQRQHEMRIPEWLVTTIYRCLEKNPQDRFENGVALHEYIVKNSVRAGDDLIISDERVLFLEEENKRLREEREYLQQQITQLQQQNIPGSNTRITPISRPTNQTLKFPIKPKPGISLPKVLITILVAVLIAVATYFLLQPKESDTAKIAERGTTGPKRKVEQLPANIRTQLEAAKRFSDENKNVEALTIYSLLSQQGIAEAMYYYGKMGLQNANNNISCTEAFDLITKAHEKGFLQAKRTLGLLYGFADDPATLKQANYYERCIFNKDVNKAAKLLTEAMLSGDEPSSKLLQELQKRK